MTTSSGGAIARTKCSTMARRTKGTSCPRGGVGPARPALLGGSAPPIVSAALAFGAVLGGTLRNVETDPAARLAALFGRQRPVFELPEPLQLVERVVATDELAAQVHPRRLVLLGLANQARLELV